MRFFTNSGGGNTATSERMRITSGGEVLINATSRLNGYTSGFKTLNISADSGDNASIIELAGNRSANQGNQNSMIQFWNKTSTAAEVSRISSLQGSVVNSGDIQFSTSNAGTLAEAMRINANGNVGIGTDSPTSKIHVIGQDATFYSNTGSQSMQVGRNANERLETFVNDNEIKLTAYQDSDSNGAHGFIIDRSFAGSGANYFDIRKDGSSQMRVNKDGNVGIGTTSPYTPLEISSTDPVVRLNVKSGVADKSNYEIRGVGASGYEGIQFRAVNDANSVYTSLMMIEQGGNVGIGTDSPSAKLEVNGQTVINSTLAGNQPGLMWFNNQTEIFSFEDNSGGGRLLLSDTTVKVAISANSDSYFNGGNVGIGTTSPGSKLTVVAPLSSNGVGNDFQIGGGSGFSFINLKVEIPGYGTGVRFQSDSTSSLDNNAQEFYQGTSKVGSIVINTSSTSFNTTSDYRLKENREDILDAIERVKELKPTKFNWIKEPNGSKVDGFYAHELAEVVPEAVTGKKDDLDYEGNPDYQAIDQSKIVPLLTAALQQAIDKIEALEQRIQLIENK